MTTMNASNNLNVVAGSGESKESFWSRFQAQLIRVLSGTCGYSDEDLAAMEPEVPLSTIVRRRNQP